VAAPIERRGAHLISAGQPLERRRARLFQDANVSFFQCPSLSNLVARLLEPRASSTVRSCVHGQGGDLLALAAAVLRHLRWSAAAVEDRCFPTSSASATPSACSSTHAPGCDRAVEILDGVRCGAARLPKLSRSTGFGSSTAAGSSTIGAAWEVGAACDGKHDRCRW
jgi:hypothetical protein